MSMGHVRDAVARLVFPASNYAYFTVPSAQSVPPEALEVALVIQVKELRPNKRPHWFNTSSSSEAPAHFVHLRAWQKDGNGHWVEHLHPENDRNQAPQVQLPQGVYFYQTALAQPVAPPPLSEEEHRGLPTMVFATHLYGPPGVDASAQELAMRWRAWVFWKL